MAIICGTDLSAAASGALKVARVLAAQRGDDEVVLVHVIDEDADAETARGKLDEQAASALASPQGERGNVAGVAVRAELVVGPIDDTLISFAETEGSDLIVIAASSNAG